MSAPNRPRLVVALITAAISRTVLAILAVCAFALSAAAQQPPILRIAAAADLQYVMPRIAQSFEAADRVKVEFTYGASGGLATQIENGAPFDVFLSADAAIPKRLNAEHLLVADTVSRYSLGRLVLITNSDGCGAADCAQYLMMVKHIAIANPRVAPYGQAAEGWLRAKNIYAQVSAKLVFGENVSQAAQFVASGNADVALVSASMARQMRRKPIALDAPPLEQLGGALASSKYPALARRFLAFLHSPSTQAQFALAGFEALPAGPSTTKAREAPDVDAAHQQR